MRNRFHVLALAAAVSGMTLLGSAGLSYGQQSSGAPSASDSSSSSSSSVQSDQDKNKDQSAASGSVQSDQSGTAQQAGSTSADQPSGISSTPNAPSGQAAGSADQPSGISSTPNVPSDNSGATGTAATPSVWVSIWGMDSPTLSFAQDLCFRRQASNRLQMAAPCAGSSAVVRRGEARDPGPRAV